MRIAIYGDSFAAMREPNRPRHYSWPTLLEKMLGAEITNFAKVGTSTFYSYKIFLENYTKFDYNIFLVTSPYRYTKPITFVYSNDVEFAHTINYIDGIKQHHKLTDQESEFLEHLRGWFIASDDEFHRSMQSLMVEDIVRKDNNVLIYPCFRDSIPESVQKKIGRNMDGWLMFWSKHIFKYFDIPFREQENYRENLENIACHMTEETNILFAEAVYNYIKSGTEITFPKKVEYKHSLEYYYSKKISKE